MTDDLISRQAAIDTDYLDEEIRCEMCKNPMHTSKGCDGNCEYDERLYERIMQILGKRIKPLPSAQPEQRWIPCSERLPPEENKTYWVCTDNGHQHECRWTNANPIWTHLTTDWHWNIFDIPQYTKVVAWMELPKPYDGGEQDG